MKLVEIDKVTDKTEFNSYVDFETHPTADLKCLNCQNKISINFSNLKKHQQSDFTNLSEKGAKKITDYIKEKLTEIPNSFLDYYCPIVEFRQSYFTKVGLVENTENMDLN